MQRFVDMTGWVMKEHGVPDSKLTIVNREKNNDKGQTMWRCKCECGGEIIGIGYRIKSGRIKSCGCMKAVPEFRHGETQSRLYRIWCNIKTRCSCKSAEYYKNYGARGISVCDEWRLSYTAFRDWALSAGYEDNLTIDRINANGNYEPSNCRWATWKEQENNSSHNVNISYNNKTMTLHQWSEELNIPYDTLRSRVRRRGWSVKRAFTQPVKKRSATQDNG